MANSILVTGASGQVGTSVLHHLLQANTAGDAQLLAGVRSIKADRFPPGIHQVPFDFENPLSAKKALTSVNTLFLLRPPQLSRVDEIFVPLLRHAVDAGVAHVVFLSVQGAGEQKRIPHHGIEKAVEQSGLHFTHLRPAYFMQNFTSTLHYDLVHRREIFLPAGKAPFTLIDVADIGAIAARILLHPAPYAGKAYTLTNGELLTFERMAAILSEAIGHPIQYKSPGLFHFMWRKRQEGMPWPMVLVMIMLHYLPRFSPAPELSDDAAALLGKPPVSFEAFAQREAAAMQ